MARSVLSTLFCALLAASTDGHTRESEPMPARETLEWSRAIELREAAECRFDPHTEYAFDGLLLTGGEPARVFPAALVSLGKAHFRPQFSRKDMSGGKGGYEYASSVDLPAGSTWRGLPLLRLWAEFVAPPETDSLYRRGLTFAATPETLHSVLAAQGADVPISPDFRMLEDHAPFSSGTCGGSIMIEPTPGGSALVCDRGC